MGKRNRSRAMVLARKRRGGAAAKPAAGAKDGGDAGAIPNKITFDDDDDDDDDDDGDGDVREVPPPPPPRAPDEKIVLPRTSAPWFSRTLSARSTTHFEEYYRRQNILADEREWSAFLAHLRAPLPVTFRMSIMASHRAGVEEALREGKRLLTPGAENPRPRTDDGRVVPPPRRLDWCDGWQLGVDKMTLKYSRDATLRETQRWLVKHNSTGVLTRQAVDSMVPAAILGVEPHHAVLDLCASPGSKTTQCLEALHAGGETGGGGAPAGCVAANDIDPRRCYFLVRRCAALGAATQALMVTNHHAQWFPNGNVPLTTVAGGTTPGRGRDAIAKAIAKAKANGAPGSAPLAPFATREDGGRYPEGSFDRIICDVPCSGDGTLRKNPQIWSEWRPEFAMGLHALQLRIAQRGVALLKVGGYMVYSTCSFNPVENEAVVAELLRRCGDAIELVDASDRVKGLRRREGMTTWKVITTVDDEILEVRSISHWSPYDRDGVVNADP